jgi:hypothetical protein
MEGRLRHRIDGAMTAGRRYTAAAAADGFPAVPGTGLAGSAVSAWREPCYLAEHRGHARADGLARTIRRAVLNCEGF